MDQSLESQAIQQTIDILLSREIVVGRESDLEDPIMEATRAMLSEEARRHSRSARRLAVAIPIVGLLIGLITLLFVTDQSKGTIFSVLIAVYGIGLPLLHLLPSRRGLRERRRKMASSLAGEFDVRSIGPLIDVWKTDDKQTTEISEKALIDLLPRLKASDSALLDEQHRARLCYCLSLPLENPLYKDARSFLRPATEKQIAFRVAILQAFKQVGDSSAFPFVERLAKREAKTTGEKRVKEAAEVCLPVLRLRAKQERPGRTLLRAADGTMADENKLLRPVAGARESDSEMLLRPGQRDG